MGLKTPKKRGEEEESASSGLLVGLETSKKGGEEEESASSGQPVKLTICKTTPQIRNVASPDQETSMESESSPENSDRPLSRRLIPNPVVHSFPIVSYIQVHTILPQFTSTPAKKVNLTSFL